MTRTIVLLFLLLSGCGSEVDGTSKACNPSPTTASTWSYLIEYDDGTTVNESICSGRQWLPVDQWEIYVTPENLDALGRSYREVWILDNYLPTMTVTCGVYGGVGDSRLTIGEAVTHLSVRCEEYR